MEFWKTEKLIAACLTWLEVSKWNFASEKFPQTQSVAEDVSFNGVASALREHLRGHPAEVLRIEKYSPVIYQVFSSSIVVFLVRIC